MCGWTHSPSMKISVPGQPRVGAASQAGRAVNEAAPTSRALSDRRGPSPRRRGWVECRIVMLGPARAPERGALLVACAQVSEPSRKRPRSSEVLADRVLPGLASKLLSLDAENPSGRPGIARATNGRAKA